jgi:hypothetical protein
MKQDAAGCHACPTGGLGSSSDFFQENSAACVHWLLCTAVGGMQHVYGWHVPAVLFVPWSPGSNALRRLYAV